MSVVEKNSKNYCDLDPGDIAQDINKLFCASESIAINILGFEFVVHPHVYPSHKFRSTSTMLDAILKFTPGKSICEIGCGCGTLGQVALLKGASKLVQGDINPFAVKNARDNQKLHGLSDNQLIVYESDCFDNIPNEKFDIIVFAMPYHNDNVKIIDPLMRAFYDPCFSSIKKFITQSEHYVHAKSQILIAFSNKGNTKKLEEIFEESDFSWELFLVKNQQSSYDNRVYRLFREV